MRDFSNHQDMLTIFVKLSVCIYCIGVSSAQTNNQDPTAGNENNKGFSHFFYQTPEYPRDCQEVRDQCAVSVSSGVYLIKPDGYGEPFEVYCSNNTDFGSWTVISRRLDGSIGFNRNWEDYKKGFGFLSSEFWLGNERISFLTNQNVYQLRIEIFLSNDVSFYVDFNSFRISDEWGDFNLVDVGNYIGDAGSVITSCPQNMIYPGCACEATCENPLEGTNCETNCDLNKTCVCKEGLYMKDDTCVTLNECGCYILEENRFIAHGESYVSANCAQNCTCDGYQLRCDNYECSPHATCSTGQDSVRQCNCNEGYTGDGKTCTADVFRDCTAIRDAGQTQDGVYTILPSDWPEDSPFQVFCNMTIDGGGWTVFQRRNRGATSFYNNWLAYKNGFGDIQDEFWLGNDKLHYLTTQGNYEIRIDFITSSNSAKYAKYTLFRIDSGTNKYRVTHIGSYSGNGGDAMNNLGNDAFSTHDQDNDGWSSYDCAENHRGGWWYGGTRSANTLSYYSAYCNYWKHGRYYGRCSEANPNGDYNGGNGQNINWNYNYNCHIKYIEMKVRRTS